MKLIVAALVFVLLVCFHPITAAAQSSPGCPSPAFALASISGVGLNPDAVAVGDLNLDGNPDMVVASQDFFPLAGTAVSVHLGDGTGGFVAPVSFGVGQLPQWVAIGDLDGDGIPDLAVANYLSADVSVLLGDGLGGFAAAVSFPAGAYPGYVAIGDFDLNGTPDLAVANPGTLANPDSTVSVLLGNGLGGFAPAASFVTGTAPVTVVVADFDLDGIADLATTNRLSADVSVLLGNGTGTFSAATSFAAGTLPAGLAIGDFNRDGSPDLAVANSGSPMMFGATVSILLGNGLGGFAPAASFATGIAPVGVAVGDFNLDGKLDLATANVNSGDVSVLSGDGLGSFGPPVSIGVGSAPNRVAVGDFDLNGSSDLAVTSPNASSVSVLLSTCTALSLQLSQSGGGGTPVLIQNFHLVPGNEYYNVFSVVPCVTGPGSGPLLGPCAPTLAEFEALLAQVALPLGTPPFHFTAASASMSFGPFPLFPVVFEGVCFDFTGGTIGSVAAVARLDVQ